MKKILVQFAHNNCMIVFQSHYCYEFGEYDHVFSLGKDQISSSSTPELQDYYDKIVFFVRGDYRSDNWNIVRANMVNKIKIRKLVEAYNEFFKGK